MGKIRLIAGVLLALPLIVFGGNHFLELFELPQVEGEAAGLELLQAMRDGGLMGPIALSHVLAGALLLVPATRFFAGLLNLPMSLGIVAFHVTMLPSGTGMALFLLGTNLLVIADGARVARLFAADPKPRA